MKELKEQKDAKDVDSNQMGMYWCNQLTQELAVKFN